MTVSKANLQMEAVVLEADSATTSLAIGDNELSCQAPLDELDDMTLLYGAVGSDGLILASDSLKREAGFPSLKNKIIETKDQLCVFAWAGDRVAERAGDELKKAWEENTFDFSDLKTSLESIGNKTDRFCKDAYSHHNYKVERRLLIAFRKPSLQLWQLDVRDISRAERVTQHAIAGDAQSLTWFAAWAMPRESGRPNNVPVRQLKRFAGCLMWLGHLQRPQAIEGLSMRLITTEDVIAVNSEALLNEAETITKKWEHHLF